MRECLCGILAAVFLCIWNAEKTDANKKYAECFEPFMLYNAADWFYDRFNDLRPQSYQENAEEYVDNIQFNLVNRDHMIKQHIYISSLRDPSSFKRPKIIRAAIMLNVFLTLEAYETAVIFRVCAFFHSKIKFNSVIQTACWNLSLYMEWYFSFMLKQKAEDLCTIEKYFPEEENTFSGPLKAENICEIMKNLNLNFLKFPEEQKFIPVLQYDDNNVFNPNKLTYEWNNEKYFKSVFEHYEMPEVLENQTEDQYYEMVYYDLWSSVMAAYTDKYFELFHYILEVTKGLPHKRIERKMNIPLQFYKIVWQYAPLLNEFSTLPTETQRGVVWYTSERSFETNLGSLKYRSNAVEILRQITYYFFLPTFTKIGVNVYEIMKIINSSGPFCPLIPAPKKLNLSVDYVFDIDMREIIRLLSPN